MRRLAAVAGYFYEGTAEALARQVRAFVVPAEKKKALGVLSPHAGLIYSGAVAGAVYSSVLLPGTIVLIGPNHTGLGTPVSIMCEGVWETPLGSVEIDGWLARSILSKSPLLWEDALAHASEHSLEVQLPFIQHFRETFNIVPIQMLDTRLETCLALGRAVGEAIRERGQAVSESEPIRNRQSTSGDVLIVASSDMSHYERAAVAREKDFKAIRSLLDLDPEGLYRTVRSNGITMCGFGPAVAMLTACNLLGAAKAELIKYANSGEASGDYDRVVGYAGIVVR